jgi:hypothetical protein
MGANGRYTNYDALRECLYKLRKVGENLHWSDYLPQDLIYLPYGIGCGLAGGDWNIVSKIIEEELPTAVLVQR